ncbi:MAG: hypothetical protein EOS23_26750 [Mesorhizobium sp.]|nr:MAG: hypothetical protein EOS23_26750 [Mesorhizobium sp.]
MDLKSLRKLETTPSSVQVTPRSEDDRVLVLVKLREGSARPPYISPRAEFGTGMFSAEIRVGELRRLENDPAVESMSLSRPLSVIE